MLTDEQARRFCGCTFCDGEGCIYGEAQGSDYPCPACKGSKIDPDKRTELEELLREAQESAWSEGYQEGCSDAANYEWGHPSKNNNPYAKAPTNA